MLLRLMVSNFHSIADSQEISLVASKLKGPEEGLMPLPGGNLSALRTAVIYGANASGKTNFIKAFQFLQGAVLNSHRLGTPGGGVPRIPFALDPKKAEEVTHIEVDFIVDGVRHFYGFECNDNEFTEEWLFSYPEGKRRKEFERKGQDVDFGSSFKGQKKILVDLMRKNSLFISTATQNDHERLREIVSFFGKISLQLDISTEPGQFRSFSGPERLDSRVTKFLEEIGTGINNIRQSEVDFSDEEREVVEKFYIVIRERENIKRMGQVDSGNFAILENEFFQSMKIRQVEFEHFGANGKSYYFQPERESSGTRRLFFLMGKVFHILDKGGILVIDELEASLHTLAAEGILQLFSDSATNPKGAQLIATTHDTNLLNSSCLRRDQIWFCEKDQEGASHLFPLSDIKSRQADNFQQGYLEGRYGGIPFSGNITTLMKDK